MKKYLLLIAAAVALAPSFAFGAFNATLQGKSGDGAGNPTGSYITTNLLNWRELDTIPFRVHVTGAASNQEVVVQFDHQKTQGSTVHFGIDLNQPSFTATNGATLVDTPQLSTAGDVESYTFHVTTTAAGGDIEFTGNLAAGAHLFVGSSLNLGGSPSLGNLAIMKPGPGANSPDLKIVKTGPGTATDGSTITYTLTYSNLSAALLPNATGVQIKDTVPADLTYVANSATCGDANSPTCTSVVLSGTELTWNLGTLGLGATGSVTFQATVDNSLASGTLLTNRADINSADSDLNLSDNTSSWTTSVVAIGTDLAVSSATGTYGGTVDLTATLTNSATNAGISGQSVSFSLNGTPAGSANTDASGVATLNNVSLVGVYVGTYPGGSGSGVEATFTGGAPYAGSSGNNSLTVTTRTASVSAVANSKTYGDADPTLTTTNSGFLAGDLGAGEITFSASRVVGDTVSGSPYTITPSADDAGTNLLSNYSVTYNTADFTINPASLTVTADAQMKAYGASDPALTLQANGFKLADTAATVLTGGLTRAAGENVAVYAITQGTLAANSNYTINFTGANFMIGAATLSVTADPQSKTYGGSDPALTLQATGFQLGDSAATVLSGALTRAPGEVVGSYAISQGTLVANSNYAINFTGTNLTIGAATLTVTADAQTKTYGASDPALTYQASGFAFTDTAATVLSGSLTRAPGDTVNTYAIGQGSLVANSNYTISFTGANLTINKATLPIGPAGINITPYTVTYDAANHTATGIATGVLNEDLSNLLDLTGTTHKNIGDYSVDAWSFAGNTNYNAANGTVNDQISGKVLNVTAAGVTKIYDGTTSATVTLSTDKVSGDDVTAAFGSAAFADKNVGIGKTVTVNGISITGPQAGNYTLANLTTNATADITARPITVTAVADSKEYDGNNTSSKTPEVDPNTPVTTGDTPHFVQTFEGRPVAGSLRLVPSGTVTDGNSGNNYKYNFVSIGVSSGTITKKVVNGSIAAASKTYDGTTSATIATRDLTGVLSGDTVTLAGGTATFADPNAGIGKSVTATGLSLSGADAGNYALADTNATATADITKANQVINFANLENKVFNVDGPFTISATASSGLPVTFALSSGPAKLEGDTVTITGVGTITITATQAGDGNYNQAEMVQQFFAAVPPPALLNISTRGRVGTGDDVLIGGYIVKGQDAKTFGARGIGPSMKSAELPDVIVDPVLELHGPDGALLVKNDNYADTQAVEIEAAGLTPKSPLESTILATKPPGGYTAIVSDKAESNGIGLVELYDLSQSANATLANISTRGVVGTGDDVMIGGFIVNGKVGAAKVILRAIGPSLMQAGITNVLPDPTLELRDKDGTLIGANDNWGDDATQAAAIQATGIPPQNATESALVVSLPPGPYTVIVADKTGGKGVGLVEIFDLTN